MGIKDKFYKIIGSGVGATAILLMLSLAGCGGGGGGGNSSLTPTQQIAALEVSGAIPNLERSASMAGTDTNTNGIRDDVEAFITANYPTDPQKNAAKQLASTFQAALLVDKSDLAAVKDVSAREARAIHCIYTKFDGANGAKQPAAVVQELESVTTNTKTRLLEYLVYAKALDGTSGGLPEGDTCE